MHFSWRSSSMVLTKGAVLLCLLLAFGMSYARYAGYELMSVQSDSMSPVMHKGDVVLISKKDIDPQVGDIISFASPASPKVVITHRVIGVDAHRGMVETRGDNTSLVDQPIPAWDISGKVVRILPGMGNLLGLLKNPFGLIVTVYLPALGIIVSEVRRLSSYYATGIRMKPAKYVHYMLRPSHETKLL